MGSKKDIDYLDKILNVVLTKNAAKYLLYIILLGSILRYFIARNVSFLGDEMIHGSQSLNIVGSKMIGTALESPLWYYVTDIFHNIFGVTIVSSRFTSLLFGVASLALLYLLVSYLWNKKTGLLAAGILAVSTFHIRYTLIEMDIMFTFFVIASTYMLIRGVREKKDLLTYISSVLLGIAVLTKTIALFFALPLFVYLFYTERKDWKKAIKKALIYGIILFVLISPILFHNILLYQEKGYTDLYVGQYFDINKEAQQQIVEEKYLNPFSVSEMGKTTWARIKDPFLTQDPIIFLLGVIGLVTAFWLWRTKEHYLLAGMIILGWFLETGTNSLPTHYIPYIVLFSIYAAYILNKVLELPSLKKVPKQIPAILIGIILLANIFIVSAPLQDHLTSTTGNKDMRDFVREEIPENALLIVDSRIYRGRVAWLFHDRRHVESMTFAGIINQVNQENFTVEAKDVYFIECGIDDCGWGTIGNSKLNTTTEELVQIFSQGATLLKEIPSGGGYNEDTGTTHFKVYKATIELPQGIEQAFVEYAWLFHPIQSKGSDWDAYTPHPKTFIGKTMWLFSYLILWITIILALLAPFALIYELGKQKIFNTK